eukprot:jgi/Orpsp1_1/1191106/evm.model.d7180000083568.1
MKDVLAKDNSLNKRDSASGECAYINSLLGEMSTFNCCTHTKITCLNNHISE